MCKGWQADKLTKFVSGQTFLLDFIQLVHEERSGSFTII